MKAKDQKQLSNRKGKSSSVSASPLKSKPISMSKSKEAASLKLEKKKNLVALRLAMLEQGDDSISCIHHLSDKKANPDPTPEPSTSTKSAIRKSVHKTRELNSLPESSAMMPVEELQASLSAEQGNDSISSIDHPNGDQFSPIPIPEPLALPKSIGHKSVSTTTELDRSSDSFAMKRAEELRATLSTEHPILIKCMLHSNVSAHFWLGFPREFYKKHLPVSNTMMVLMDELGRQYEVKYLAAKAVFGAGWKIFSTAHNLKEGDVVVFQLVKSTTFKVYIVKHDTSDKSNGATIQHGLDACAEEDEGEKDKNAASGEENDMTISNSQPAEPKEFKSFEEFSILLDGSVSIDAEFPDHLRRKYYDLCKSQNSPLHKNLPKHLNRTLVVGMINETINIADAIGACSIPQSDLMAWDRTLQSFELVGMNVSFLREQISLCVGFALQDACKEAKMEREVAGERMKSLKVKFLELSEKMEEIDVQVEKMEEMTKRYQLNTCFLHSRGRGTS